MGVLTIHTYKKKSSNLENKDFLENPDLQNTDLLENTDLQKSDLQLETHLLSIKQLIRSNMNFRLSSDH